MVRLFRRKTREVRSDLGLKVAGISAGLPINRIVSLFSLCQNLVREVSKLKD